MKITHYLPAVFLITATASAHAIEFAPLASMGGQIYAASEVCNTYSASELQALKAKQKSDLEAKGISAQDYDKYFEIGYEKAQHDLKTMSQTQKENLCKELTKLKP